MRRTDALAELFKELEQDLNGYESVPVPTSSSGAEDATQELPPVAGDARGAPRGGAGAGRAVSGVRQRRATVAVVIAAAAVVGFAGAFLFPADADDDGAAAGAPAASATASASAPPSTPEPTDEPGAREPGAGAPGGDAPGAAQPEGPVACTASYRTVSSWQGGYQGEVTVTNAPAAPASGWTATVVPADGARLTQVWDATLSAARAGTATVVNASWNGALAPGASVRFGFIADASGSAGAPTAKVTCAATAGRS